MKKILDTPIYRSSSEGPGPQSIPKDEICQLRLNGRLWRLQVSFFSGCYDLVSGAEIITIKANSTLREIISALMEVNHD